MTVCVLSFTKYGKFSLGTPKTYFHFILIVNVTTEGRYDA